MLSVNISPLNQQLKPALIESINQKTKPIGALGILESIALQVGLVQNTLTPALNNPSMLVFAGDHGVVQAGVSAYPQEVTAQMVLNFLAGGAAINVFAKQHGFNLRIIDSGVNYDFLTTPSLINAKIAHGTANFLVEPAMTNEQCQRALTHGLEITKTVLDADSNLIAFGEMGIGNTSSASCLMSVFCDLPIAACIGRGTGLDDAGLKKKIALLEQAVDKHNLNAGDPILALATFGGFEIAMVVGAILASAEAKAVILIDGFIATAALLVAVKLEPNVLAYCVFSHCSDEPGHQKMLQHLNVKPLLNMGLRLGEGTGAVLAYPLVQSAVNFLNQMASFETAGVSEKSDVD